MWPGVPFWNDGTEIGGSDPPGGGGTANPCGTPGSDYEKLEGQFTAGPDGHSVVVNVNGGGNVTVPALVAGAQYWVTSNTSALYMIGVNLAIYAGGTWTVTLDDGDVGTGKVTIARSGGLNWTLAWGTDTTLRDYLGFEEDLSGAASYTGTKACPYVWLVPRQRWFPPMPDGHDGKPVSNTKITASPSGTTKALYFGGRHHANMLLWKYVKANKVIRDMETVENESFESFFETVIERGYPVRYHHDRSDDATYNQWRMGVQWAVQPEHESLVGRGCDGADLYWQVGPYPVRTHRQ